MDRYTVAEACALLGVSRTTLYRLFAAGELERTPPTTTPPRKKVYIPGESLHAYQAKQAAEHKHKAV
jgi:excisionase family DNA binding protein